VERALPAAAADALLAELLDEGLRTWGQDAWWIAGEPRLAPRLTAQYEMNDDGGGGVGRVGSWRRNGRDGRDDGVAVIGNREEVIRQRDKGEDDGLPSRLASPSMRAAAARAGDVASEALRECSGGVRVEVPCSQAAGSDDRQHDGERWTPTHAVGNLYRTGADAVGPHVDQLTTLGPLPTIAGLSLGRALRVQGLLRT
jgi:hypothetical protein